MLIKSTPSPNSHLSHTVFQGGPDNLHMNKCSPNYMPWPRILLVFSVRRIVSYQSFPWDLIGASPKEGTTFLGRNILIVGDEPNIVQPLAFVFN